MLQLQTQQVKEEALLNLVSPKTIFLLTQEVSHYGFLDILSLTPLLLV